MATQTESVSPLCLVLVNLQSSFFSQRAPFSQTSVSGERKSSQYWVGEKNSAKVLGGVEGSSSPLLQFIRWVSKKHKGKKLFVRMHQQTAIEDESCLGLLNENDSFDIEEANIQTKEELDTEALARLKSCITLWTKTLQDGKSSIQWPRMCVIGGWTGRHIYHVCYELRSMMGNPSTGLLSTCAMLTASPRDENHWNGLSRLTESLNVKVCRTIIELIQWCQCGSISTDLARSIVGVPDKSDWPKVSWETDIPQNFDHNFDMEILALLYRGSLRIKLYQIHDGWKGGFVINVKATSHAGHELKPTVVKIGKREIVAGEYEAFCRVEDLLGNNAPSVRGFVELGQRAGVKFRCTGMSQGIKASGTLKDRLINHLPVVLALNEIFEEVFDGWYSSKRLETFDLYEYYTAGFETVTGERRVILALDGPQLQQMASFLLNTPGGNCGGYYKEELESFQGYYDKPMIKFEGLTPTVNIGYLIDDELNGIPLLKKMQPQTLLSTFAHGDANVNNFIVDEKQNVWVIDFALSHPNNHILRDIVRLLCSVLFMSVPIESTDLLAEIVVILRTLTDIEDLQEDLPQANELGFRLKTSSYIYSEVVLTLWAHIKRVVTHPDRIDQRNALQFQVAFFAEAARHIKYRTPTLYNKQLAFIAAGLAGSAAARNAKRAVSVVVDNLQVDGMLGGLFVGTLKKTAFPLSRSGKCENVDMIEVYMNVLKQNGVTHLVVDLESIRTSAASHRQNLIWPLATKDKIKTVAENLNIKVIDVPSEGGFENGFEESIKWVSNILKLLYNERPENGAVGCCFASFMRINPSIIFNLLACTLVAMGDTVSDSIKKVASKDSVRVKRFTSKKLVEEFSRMHKRVMVKEWLSWNDSKLMNSVAETSQIPGLSPLDDFTPRTVLELRDGADDGNYMHHALLNNATKMLPDVPLNKVLIRRNSQQHEAMLPLSITTLPSEYVKFPVSPTNEPDQFNLGRDEEINADFLQAVALKKMTVSNDLTLDEYLKSSCAFFGSQSMKQPLDLSSGDADSTKKTLTRFVAKSLMAAEEEISFEHVIAGNAKGNTGDAVSFVTDNNPNRSVLAVMKIFQKVSTFERELAALARASDWFRNDPLVKSPRAISAEFLKLPEGKNGGVLIMSAAQGAPLDDMMLLVCRVSGDYRLRLFERLKTGVELAAQAFFLFHTKMVSTSPSVLTVHDAVEKALEKLGLIFDHLNELKSIDKDLAKHILDLIGSQSTIVDNLHRMAEMAEANVGLGCVCHGDAHLGNVFVGDDLDSVTFIDLESINHSVGAKGEPLGSAAQDVTNFVHKIRQNGVGFGLSDDEISQLQSAFMDTYMNQHCDITTLKGGVVSPQTLLTNEMFDLFYYRRQLGGIHRKLIKENNPRASIPSIIALETTVSRSISRYQAEYLEVEDNKIDETTNGAGGTFEGKEDIINDLKKVYVDGNENVFSGNHDDDDSSGDEDKSDSGDSETETEEQRDDAISFMADLRQRKEPQHIYRAAYEGRSRLEETKKQSMEKNFTKWVSRRMKAMPTPRRPKPIPQGSSVYLVLGIFEKTPEHSGISIGAQKLLKRLVGVLSKEGGKGDNKDKNSTQSTVILIGGRAPGQNVSVARSMKRWLQDFRLKLNVVIEELSLTPVEQVVFALSLLHVRKFRTGTLSIICSEASMSYISHVFSKALKTKSDRTSSYNLEYLTVATGDVFGSDDVHKSLSDVEEAQSELKKLKSLGTGRNRKWPYEQVECLLWSARAGALSMIKYIALHSQELKHIDDIRDNAERTALHVAAAAGHYDCTLFLLKLGADPNAKDENNATPLHYAVASGAVSIAAVSLVHLLIGFGANGSLRGSCCHDEKRDMLQMFYAPATKISFQPSRWKGSLTPFEIARRYIDSLDFMPQSQQPLWTSILFLAHPVNTLGSNMSPGKREQRVLCIRHGESIWNAEGPSRSKGLIDSPMTIKGYQQCVYLRCVLKQNRPLDRLNIQLIVVSPLTRALETYMETLHWWKEENPTVRVVIDPRISEKMNASVSRGTPKSILAKRYPQIDFGDLHETWWYKPSALAKDFKERQEPNESVLKRVTEFAQWLSQQPEQNVLVVGHGHCFRTLASLSLVDQAPTTTHPSIEVMGYDKEEAVLDTTKIFRCNLDAISLKLTCLEDSTKSNLTSDDGENVLL